MLPVNIKFADRRRCYDAFGVYHGEEHPASALAELIAGYETAEQEKRISILRGGECQ